MITLNLGESYTCLVTEALHIDLLPCGHLEPFTMRGIHDCKEGKVNEEQIAYSRHIKL